MRILMLGNSFTATNNLPQQLASLTRAEVVAHTRGGARLAEQMNPKTKMGARTLAALENEHWDYVILQEMSNGPATAREKFLQSARGLCEKIRDAGAIPVFYATWAYEKGSKKMAAMNMSYEEMYQAMYEAYHHAAQENQALIADVGKAFYESTDQMKLYADDGCHPNEMGTKLAAEVIAVVVLQDT